MRKSRTVDTVRLFQTVKKLVQPKDSEGKIIGKKTVRVVFPV